MTTTSRKGSCACDVHFVGSVPLANASEVMQTLSARLGPWLRRLPDGETGERTNWIQYQEDVIARLPGAEKVGGTGDMRSATAKRAHTGKFRIPVGTRLEPTMLGDLGYALAAIESFNDYAVLRANGAIAPECRFMVALPTPYNIISFCVMQDSAAAVEKIYEQQLIAELSKILAAIPHDQLSLQWDVVHDLQAFDTASLNAAVATGRIPSADLRKPWFTPAKQGIVDRLVRLCGVVPAEVELGIHLCYGSYGGRHFIEPESMAAMVEMTNAVSFGIMRRLDFIHMPVPIERDDDAYFAPLKNLKRPAALKLYLGLIHESDGLAGTMRRHETARRHSKDFGVSTECGFGRMSIDAVPGIMATHEQVMRAIEARSA
jgi:hypothetical protein